jgi:hypothetical protein
MLRLHQLQAAAVDRIKAHDYFEGEVVLADRGKSLSAAETALKDRGFVVLVSLPLDATTTSQGAGLATALVTIAIRLEISLQIYAQSPGTFEDFIAAIIHAMIDLPDPPNPRDRWQLDGQAFVLDDQDEGLLAAEIFFRKLVAL